MIRILASDAQQAELKKAGPDETAISWTKNLDDLVAEPADVYLDLLFQPVPARATTLKKLSPSPVIIHSITHTLESLQLPFARINCWPGFLERPVIECAVSASLDAASLSIVSACLNKQFIFLPDIAGFVSARIIAMIINEAYYALEEGVGSRSDMNIAMKTGTNYPYGPFEWAEKIGIRQIHDLLNELTKTDHRYQPSPLLAEESVKHTF